MTSTHGPWRNHRTVSKSFYGPHLHSIFRSLLANDIIDVLESTFWGFVKVVVVRDTKDENS